MSSIVEAVISNITGGRASMNCVQLIFSPTGGTMRAAKAITDPWGPGVETIDLTDPALTDRAFQKEDLVLIAVPSYGGRVPELAAQRLTKMLGTAPAASCAVFTATGPMRIPLWKCRILRKSRGFGSLPLSLP